MGQRYYFYSEDTSFLTFLYPASSVFSPYFVEFLLQEAMKQATFAKVKPEKYIAQVFSIKLKKMNTNKNKKNGLLAIPALLLMIGSGALLGWTINDLYNTVSPLWVISLSFISVLLYITGASLMGWSLRKRNRYSSYEHAHNGVLFAFLLIAGGLLMLFFNTGTLNPVWKSFFFSWPMLLCIIGAINVCKFHFISGITCAAAGKFFLIEKAAGIFPGNFAYEQFASTYWPALIIICGVLILSGILFHPGRCRRNHYKGNWEKDYIPDENENNDGKINYRFTFGGTEQVILDPVFRGGTIDVTFGGMELDLRRTSLAEGDTFLYVKAVLGGVEITAPDNWEIEIHSKGFVGGVSDSRVKNIDKDRTRKLILVAKSTFGGIEIK
jgi:predicted membrane protein